MPKSPEPQYDVDLGDFYGEEETWDADYIELDADEVIAAGVECSREYHFAVSGTAMEQPLAEILNRHGLDMTGSNTYSYNEQYDNGDTWYVTWTVYDLNDGENGAYQYAELDYDTATEALHQIDITLEDPQVLGDVSGEVLEMLEESGAPVSYTHLDVYKRQILSMATKKGQSERYYCEGGQIRHEVYDGKQKDPKYPKKDDSELDIPIAVLMNGQSASCLLYTSRRVIYSLAFFCNLH